MSCFFYFHHVTIHMTLPFVRHVTSFDAARVGGIQIEDRFIGKIEMLMSQLINNSCVFKLLLLVRVCSLLKVA